MNNFKSITSLADLKKQYRTLAIANHPDKGGSTQAMQEINGEFEKLFKVWEDRPAVNTKTGYENDYAGASAKEYTEHVYNEYRFTGSNYSRQNPKEICEIIRKWLKETYPAYKFSVTNRHYNSITVTLIQADFEAFLEKGVIHKEFNLYRLEREDSLTDRAKEVILNVFSRVNSYNFDDSDIMTDYFHCNFYLSLNIGDYKHPYTIVIPKLNHKGKKPEVFKRPEGAAHKAIRQALGKAVFTECKDRRGERILLCDTHFDEKGKEGHWPLDYSSRKTAKKRMDKLMEAGINCRLTECNGGYIEFSGYTPETEAALEREKQAADLKEKQWNEKHKKGA